MEICVKKDSAAFWLATVMANARHYLLSRFPLMGKSACKALFRLCARRGQQKPTINGNLLKKDSAANCG